MSKRKQHPEPGNVRQGQTWYHVWRSWERGPEMPPVIERLFVVSHKTPDLPPSMIQPVTPQRLLRWPRGELWRSRRKALTAYRQLEREYWAERDGEWLRTKEQRYSSAELCPVCQEPADMHFDGIAPGDVFVDGFGVIPCEEAATLTTPTQPQEGKADA